MPKVITICFVVAIAEVYKNEGNDEYKKNNFNSAIFFYTEGIKVNCKDEDLNAKLYSNRAAAHFNLGKKLIHALYLLSSQSHVSRHQLSKDFSSCSMYAVKVVLDMLGSGSLP